MKRNASVIVIGILMIVVAVGAYLYYNRETTSGWDTYNPSLDTSQWLVYQKEGSFSVKYPQTWVVTDDPSITSAIILHPAGTMPNDSAVGQIYINMVFRDAWGEPQNSLDINGTTAVREDAGEWLKVTIWNERSQAYSIVLTKVRPETRTIFDSMVSTFQVLEL